MGVGEGLPACTVVAPQAHLFSIRLNIDFGFKHACSVFFKQYQSDKISTVKTCHIDMQVAKGSHLQRSTGAVVARPLNVEELDLKEFIQSE